MQSHTNEGIEEKDTGFPLTTGGNDRGARSGHDRGAGGMTDGKVCSGRNRITTSQSSGRGPEPAVTHAGPHDSPLSFPTFSIGNPWLFPCRATQMKGQKRKTLDSR